MTQVQADRLGLKNFSWKPDLYRENKRFRDKTSSITCTVYVYKDGGLEGV